MGDLPPIPGFGPDSVPLEADTSSEALEEAEGAEATHEGRGEHEDRFRTVVAIAIALVSILGAVVAFTGTLAEQSARQLDQQGLQDAATQQEIITNLSATVQEDERNLAPYQEDIKAAELLQSQAADLQSSDPSSAAQLNAQAQSYLVEARTRLTFFQGATPQPGPSGKPVQYDANATLQRLENRDAQLSQLQPEGTLDQAENAHGKAVNLVGLVTLFIASLLFLTLAQFTRPAIRRFFAAAGGIVAIAALAVWVLVLATGS